MKQYNMRADKPATWDDVAKRHIFYSCPRWMTCQDNGRYFKLVKRFTTMTERKDRWENSFYKIW